MPTYEYVCPLGHKFEKVLRVVDYRLPALCDCGLVGQKIISAPMVFVSQDIRYESPIDGKVISSRQQRQDDLARSGCVPYDPEMKKDAERRRKEADAKIEAAMDRTVEKAIHELPAVKREKLIAEVQGGKDLGYSRSTPGV